MDYKQIIRSFCYVDVWLKQQGGRWQRIQESELKHKAILPSQNSDCFVSIQKYKSALHENGEEQWVPLYFDLDHDLDNSGKNKAVAGTSFEDVCEDVRKIITFFKNNFGVTNVELRTWYSGGKGAHITLSPVAMGLKPHVEMTYMIKQIALQLRELLKLKTLDYQGIYSTRRQWRIPGSIHGKSKRYKTEIPWQMWDTPDKIVTYAETAKVETEQALVTAADEQEIVVNNKLTTWVDKYIEIYLNMQKLHKLKPKKPKLNNKAGYPKCIQFILDNGLIVPHTGNKTSIILATFFKDFGNSMEEAMQILVPWAMKLHNISTASNKHAIEASMYSVVRSIYEDTQSKYFFCCQFIRSLGTAEKRVPCDHGDCKVVNEDDQEPATVPTVNLYEATEACYTGKMVGIPVIIAGKDFYPFIIPWVVKAECAHWGTCKESCPLKDEEGFMQKKFSIKNPDTLKLCYATDEKQFAIIKQMLGVSKCKKVSITTLERKNVEEVRIVPQIGTQQYMREIDSSLNGKQKYEYVQRRAFYFGYGLKTNAKYRIQAYLLPDPWQQRGIFTFSEMEPLVEDFRNFEMTPDYKKLLEVFQCRPGQSVETKFDEITTDLTANVHKIRQRGLMNKSIDLVYHSALSFKFLEDTVHRGWLELLIIGDSGQGKSKMLRTLMSHYQLGEWVQGESAGRTGLVYTIQKNNDQWYYIWGVLPLNDGALVAIDEMQGIKPSDFSELSELRESGVAKVDKAVHGETQSRCRLIYLANSRQGIPLEQFNYGVEAITGSRGLIPQREDVRRIDFALAVTSSQIDPAIYNKRYNEKAVPHVYTSALCNLLIRWTWSRSPENIIILEDAEDLILKFALKMSSEYVASIPLVEPADQRMKLARLSVAAAARVFSCDDTGQKLIVTKDHVIFAYEHLNKLYKMDELGYYLYSKQEKWTRDLNDEQLASIKTEILQLHYWEELKDILLFQDIIKVKELEEMLAIEYPDAKRLCRLLIKNRLIRQEKGSSGFVKTPAFVKLLKEIKKKGIVTQKRYQNDNDFLDDMEALVMIAKK